MTTFSEKAIKDNKETLQQAYDRMRLEAQHALMMGYDTFEITANPVKKEIKLKSTTRLELLSRNAYSDQKRPTIKP